MFSYVVFQHMSCLGKGNNTPSSTWKRGRKSSYWQRRWDEDQTRRRYHRIQRSVISKIYEEMSRREEIIRARLRVDHSGLNSTVFILREKEQ